jgi:hypothetical protein
MLSGLVTEVGKREAMQKRHRNVREIVGKGHWQFKDVTTHPHDRWFLSKGIVDGSKLGSDAIFMANCRHPTKGSGCKGHHHDQHSRNRASVSREDVHTV